MCVGKDRQYYPLTSKTMNQKGATHLSQYSFTWADIHSQLRTYVCTPKVSATNDCTSTSQQTWLGDLLT